ncbi:MAG: HEAT repeat domain-containing protein [Gemmatimonadetes bacterium]|nr:HEAT repeat domain-containing protein [Gemmatimonadota bacterium]
MARVSSSLGLLVALAATGAPSAAQTSPNPRDAVMWSAILSAEDSRTLSPMALGPLVGGLRYPDPDIRRLAVRGLGRLERDTLAPVIARALNDSSPLVRAEASNALGQAVSRGRPNLARDSLLARLGREPDPNVRGAIAQTLGRLPAGPTPEESAVEQALHTVSADTAVPSRLGAARGYEAWLRRLGRNAAPSRESADRLRELVRAGLPQRGRPSPARADSLARVRRLALAALTVAGQAEESIVRTALTDPDPQVRRLAIAATGAPDSFPGRSALLGSALARDQSTMVRYEALRVYGRRAQAFEGCAPLLRALSDKSPHVVLLAIDLLGGGCDPTSRAQAIDRLAALAGQLVPAYGDRGAGGGAPTWHQPAHALVALARLARERADSLLPRYAGHASWWVRTYAAQAATVLRTGNVLEQLGLDVNDNVRTAAITGLSSVRGHQTDSIYIAALSRPDYELLLTAARALDGTPDTVKAVPALLAALQRVTGESRETSRDARIALLRRIGALGSVAQAGTLQFYLYDFDSVVADETARILNAWGQPQNAAPNPLPPQALPPLAVVRQMAATNAVVHMRGGASFELRLRPLDAPTNVERFVRLARSGFFDGLTFHRVVPNFVIQGGSPGANEYWGDGPYTRDELTLDSHVRGTVGISTRGRDTGDGQIFVNLVDNPRLDHNYTIIGEDVAGMDVVEAVLEGATIERIELVEGGKN